jgi:hypothetical protein
VPSQYLVILLHSSACWFYWVARIKGFSEDTWLANNFDLVASQNITTQYLYSLYFCVTTFATVGYGDIHAYTIPEVILIMIFMIINMVGGQQGQVYLCPEACTGFEHSRAGRQSFSLHAMLCNTVQYSTHVACMVLYCLLLGCTV